MTPAQFELIEVEQAPRLVVGLRGEVDATNAADFERAIAAMTASGPVVLDLSRVSYFDSAGFEVLDRLLATGSLIAVISGDSALRSAAALMGVRFHDTLEQARAAVVTDR